MPPAVPDVLEKPATQAPVEPDATVPAIADVTPTTARGILQDAPRPFVLRRRAADRAVAGRVEHHWSTRWSLPAGVEHDQRVLPHPSVHLVVHDGVVRVHGVPTGVDVRRLAGSGSAIGTKFRPGAFAALTTIPMSELRDEAATLEEAFGPEGSALEERLLASGPDEDAVWDAVAAFVALRSPSRDHAYALVRGVAADMLGRSPDARIPDVARDHGVSERTLQRAFRTCVGVSPKWVLRRYRLHAATERLAAAPDQDLARLAYDLGYADQAHFAGDFRATVGVAPSAYARACRALRPVTP